MTPFNIMRDIPQIIGGDGHGEITHASKVNTAKNVDANFKQMIKDGRIAPETPAEMQMLKEHETNSDNALDEPIEDALAMDADALASAGYGTDEDYGGVNRYE